MLEEFLKLGCGILLAWFHRPIADFILEQDYALAALLHTKGLRTPALPRRSTAHTIYFLLGIFVAVLEMWRIWVLVSALPR